MPSGGRNILTYISKQSNVSKYYNLKQPQPKCCLILHKRERDLLDSKFSFLSHLLVRDFMLDLKISFSFHVKMRGGTGF